MRQIILIAHDMRSTHNVGSLLRTAEGLGVAKVILSGYTPFPKTNTDTRLPHIAEKLTKDIHKTALGAETMQLWEQTNDLPGTLLQLQTEGFVVAALEQSPRSIALPDFHPPNKIALLLGSEVQGIDPELLATIPLHIEIPMFGQKESFNVVQAAAMALFRLRFA